MSQTCSRCRVRSPDGLGWPDGWAATFPTGVMCPACFRQLEDIRRKVADYQRGLMEKFMDLGRCETVQVPSMPVRDIALGDESSRGQAASTDVKPS